jgi:hypothetical protein
MKCDLAMKYAGGFFLLGVILPNLLEVMIAHNRDGVGQGYRKPKKI